MPKRVKKVKVIPIRWNGGCFFAIPRNLQTYDSIVDQMIVSIFNADDEPHWNRGSLYPYYRKHAVAALRSIGITRNSSK